MLVLGLGGAAISIVSGDLSITISGMSLASIVGIILNIVLPESKEIYEEEIIKTTKTNTNIKKHSKKNNSTQRKGKKR